jgi:uncharacterized protein YggT (Ycf19 family)
MSPSSGFLTYWHFQIPNLILAGLIYLLVARLILSSVLAPDNAIMQPLRAITEPVVKVASALTPRVVPAGVVIVFAIMWLFVARMILTVVGPAG